MEKAERIQIVAAQSMAADITSLVVPIPYYAGYSVQANYATSGTLGGVLALQASDDHQEDPEGNVLHAGNWVTITNTPVTLTGAGSYMWNVTTANYSYFRLIYTHLGGDSGTLNAYCTIKEI
jgi:hypothetical protein